MPLYLISKEGRFEASHILKGHTGKCGYLHGHSYRFVVRLAGRKLNDIGILEDFGNIPIKQIEEAYDHTHLNDVGKNFRWVLESNGEQDLLSRLFSNQLPTLTQTKLQLKQTSAECIAQTIFTFVKEYFKEEVGSQSIRVHSVTVWETAKCQATYDEE